MSRINFLNVLSVLMAFQTATMLGAPKIMAQEAPADAGVSADADTDASQATDDQATDDQDQPSDEEVTIKAPSDDQTADDQKADDQTADGQTTADNSKDVAPAKEEVAPAKEKELNLFDLRVKCYNEKSAEIAQLAGQISQDDATILAQERMKECDDKYPSPNDSSVTVTKEEKNDVAVDTTNANTSVAPVAAKPKKNGKSDSKHALLGYVFNTKTGSSLLVMIDLGISPKLLMGHKINLAANAQIFSSEGGYLIPKLDLRADTDIKPSQNLAKVQNFLHLPFLGAEFSRDKALDRSWQLSGYLENRASSSEHKWRNLEVSGNGSYGVRAGFGGTGDYAFMPLLHAYAGAEGRVCQPFGDKGQHQACVYGGAKAKAGVYEIGYGFDLGTGYNYKVDPDSAAGKYVKSVGADLGVDLENDYDVSGSHGSGYVGISGKVRW